MTEPFLPHHSNDDIDAADPGHGAPGHEDSVQNEAELDAQVEAFEQRLDAERGETSLFRTPKPE